MKIYCASSWKNTLYESTIALLNLAGHEVLDWRSAGGFGWHQVTDLPKKEWTGQFYRDEVLTSRRAEEGFKNDAEKMGEADICVLLLPCGRSAHLEAGWFVGEGRPLHIFIPVFDEPELMYKLADSISFSIEELITAIEKRGC